MQANAIEKGLRAGAMYVARAQLPVDGATTTAITNLVKRGSIDTSAPYLVDGWSDASARAFSDHSGSYPELTKKFAHSVGVNSSMISAMAAQRSSTVRAAAFLSNALSFEKACSMGLKSGE